MFPSPSLFFSVSREWHTLFFFSSPLWLYRSPLLQPHSRLMATMDLCMWKSFPFLKIINRKIML